MDLYDRKQNGSAGVGALLGELADGDD